MMAQQRQELLDAEIMLSLSHYCTKCAPPRAPVQNDPRDMMPCKIHHLKCLNFITRLYSMDLFTVFGKLFWDLFHYEIKSYSLENKVNYVLKIGKRGKRQF